MRAAILTLGLVLYTVVSFAGSIADTYVIPVAGHVSGANGETWITDVTLHNVGDSTIVVDLAGIGPDGDVISLNTESATIAAHETVALRDVVRPSAVGALVVAGSGPFTGTTRVYTAGPAGDVGTDVPAVNEFLGPDTGAAFLPGIISNSRYRTNIGFLAIADATDLQFEITLLDAAGTPIGRRTFEVAAGRAAHRQFSSRDIAPASFDSATARVTLIAGDGAITAYASVIDHASSDSSFIPAAVLDSGSANALRRHVFLLRQAPGSQR